MPIRYTSLLVQIDEYTRRHKTKIPPPTTYIEMTTIL